jgi:hypothetical protein
MSFDYHRAMTDAVAQAPNVAQERLVWIMNDAHRAKYRHFLEHVMGGEPDDSESFGIPIETGEPSNGEPFELVVRPTH